VQRKRGRWWWLNQFQNLKGAIGAGRGIFQDSEVTRGGMKYGEKVVVRLLYLRLT
jgi:hypothetical protein